MGDTLAKPVTDKHSSELDNGLLRVGVTGMQGWRRGMEDAHACVLGVEPGEATAFFGVYDGHCGQATARFCGEQLHRRVAAQDAFRKGDWEQALQSGFLATDSDVASNADLRADGSGCTAVSCLITRDLKLACGNAGDSRCVLCRGGEALPLSFDHKPTNEGEMKRIQAAGAFVAAGRVNGNLALSRAIGDLEFKQNEKLPPEQQAITAFPEVTVTDLSPEDEFMVLACDGIWDVMTSSDVVSFVRERLKPGCPTENDLALICEELCDKCLAPAAPGLGCDNMTAMVVQFMDPLRIRVEKNRRASDAE